MSKQEIQDKIEEIRNETQRYGNTRERVATVLTRLNDEKLDAETLPTNLATIDKGAKTGNTYTKLQADDKFLKKTDTTISAPTSEYKFVYLTNEANETRRMLAGDLGKNIANSTLVSIAGAGFTQGANWTHNTAGFYYNIKGLPDKSNDADFTRMRVQDVNGQEAWSNGKPVLEGLMNNLSSVKDKNTGNYDPNYSEYLVYNPQTKKLAKSDRPQIVSNFNVPSTININYPPTIANSNYTPAPDTPADISDTFEMIKGLETNYQFTLITPDMWLLRTMADEKIAPYSDWRVPTDINQTSVDGTLYLKGFNPPADLVNNLNFTNSVRDENSFFTMFLNIEFPANKDWIVRFRVHDSNIDGILFNERGSFFGFAELTQTTQSRKDITDVTTDEYRYLNGLIKNNKVNISRKTYVYFIKKGSKLSLFLHNIKTGGMYLSTADFQNYMKYFRIGTDILNSQKIEMGKLLNTYLTEFSYWIEP